VHQVGNQYIVNLQRFANHILNLQGQYSSQLKCCYNFILPLDRFCVSVYFSVFRKSML